MVFLCVFFFGVFFFPSFLFLEKVGGGATIGKQLFCLFVFLILHFETADCSCVRACGWCFFFFPSLALPKLLGRSVNITCEFPSRKAVGGKKLLVKTSHPWTPLRPSHRPNLLRRFFPLNQSRGFFFFLFLVLLFPPIFPRPVLCIWKEISSRLARWDASFSLFSLLLFGGVFFLSFFNSCFA